MDNIKININLNKQKNIALEKKFNEMTKLLKPYTKEIGYGFKEVIIPNKEIFLKYIKLLNEIREIINELNLMDKN
jgi:hypothetical protein